MKTIGLRFAKATEEDVAAVQIIGLILDDLESGEYPRNAQGEYTEGDPEWFDIHDADDCRVALQRLLEVVGRIPGGFMRISGLAHVALNNDVFDPDKDHLVWHPDLAPAVEKRRRRRIVEAVKKDPAISPVIEWQRYDGGPFNPNFSGYEARHYNTGHPEQGWVLGYKFGGGDITVRQVAPEDGMEPVHIREGDDVWTWRWVQFGKEASHG